LLSLTAKYGTEMEINKSKLHLKLLCDELISETIKQNFLELFPLTVHIYPDPTSRNITMHISKTSGRPTELINTQLLLHPLLSKAQ
jgi:hypothetical protein